MLFSQIIPIPLLLHLITPRARISSIYCRAHLPACYPPAPRGFQVIAANAASGIVDLLNLATGTHASVNRSEITNIRVYVTWEI